MQKQPTIAEQRVFMVKFDFASLTEHDNFTVDMLSSFLSLAANIHVICINEFQTPPP